MLREALRTYLKDVEKAILSLNDAYIERYEEEILTQERTNLRIRVRFQSGYLLELNEAVIVRLASIEKPGDGSIVPLAASSSCSGYVWRWPNRLRRFHRLAP